MHRAPVRPRVSNFVRTPKRKREDEYEREDQRRTVHPGSSASDSRATMVEWKLTFGQPVALSITRSGHKSRVSVEGMRLGSERETVKFDGVTAVFCGTEMTTFQICLTLPNGHTDVKWFGSQIRIDETYSIYEEGFHMTNRPVSRTRPIRTIFATVDGEGTEPMTLTHAKRSYIIRFEAGFPAIVLPRCIYYPLKLTMMKDFLEKFVPKELFTRSPKAAAQLAEDSRLPSPIPHTPTIAIETDDSGDRFTPPSQYVRYERSRFPERQYEDENSDD